MSHSKLSKPILRRSSPNTKVPTILSVPDVSADAASPEPIPHDPSHVDVHEDSSILHASANEAAPTMAEPPIEPLPMDDLAAAAGLTVDAERDPEPELVSEPDHSDHIATSDSEDGWFTGNLRRDMGTIATIAATVVACTLVARVMKPSKTNDNFAQPSAVASAEEPQQFAPQQNGQQPEANSPNAQFAQTQVQQPVGNQQPLQQQSNQPQLANQIQGQLQNAGNSAQQFVQQGTEALNQRLQGVANQVSAGAAALLPNGQQNLQNLPQVNTPAVQSNLRNAANQISHGMQLQAPQHVAANPSRPALNAPSNTQFNNAPQAPWNSQGHAGNHIPNQNHGNQNHAMGQPQQTPTPANPADLPAHLFPNNGPAGQPVDPARSANRMQQQPTPRTAQPNVPRQASAYPTTPDPSLQQIKSQWEQQGVIRGDAPAARVADQRAFNNGPAANTNTFQNRFEANTYQNGNQNVPSGVNR